MLECVLTALAGVERVERAEVVRALGDFFADAGDFGVLDSVLTAGSGVMPTLYLSFSSLLLRFERTPLNSGSLRIFAHEPVAGEKTKRNAAAHHQLVVIICIDRAKRTVS